MQANKYFKSGSIAAVVLLIGGAIYFMFSQLSAPADLTTTQSQTNQPTATNSREQLKQALADGALLIDVRTPEEFAAGHTKSATNLPLDNIQSGKSPQVAKDNPIYLYCRSGNRSAVAKQLLNRQGFSQVIDLGGLGDIERLGLEIVE